MSGEVIDKAALGRLLEVIGGDPEDLAELLEEFETTTPKLLADMQGAAASGDLAALRVAAHSLKSNGRDFGATALTDVCMRLEKDCKSESVDDPVIRVSEIGTELNRAREALASITL